MRMPPLPADSIHARACKLKCEKILTRPSLQTKVRKNLDTTTLLLMAFCHIKNSVFLVIGQFHMYSLNYCAR